VGFLSRLTDAHFPFAPTLSFFFFFFFFFFYPPIIQPNILRRLYLNFAGNVELGFSTVAAVTLSAVASTNSHEFFLSV
jgi:hypothetical protein